jgi:hypothetical protein
MIIDAIHLYTEEYSTTTQIATFSLKNPDLTQPYILQAAAGLDAGEFTPKFFGSSSDGSSLRYYDQGVKEREIVLKIRLNPQGAGVSNSSLRDALLKVISSSYLSKVQLRFMLSTTEKARLSGYVTKFESSLFSNVPEVLLTITCPDPYLIDPTLSTITGLNNVNPVFADTDSTAPHGFTMNITIPQTLALVKFYKGTAATPYWYFTVIYSFLLNDVLTMVSIENKKDLYVTRSGTKTSLLDKIASGSTWPILFPGSTTFTVDMQTVSGSVYTSLASPTWTFGTISHNKTYWGL